MGLDKSSAAGGHHDGVTVARDIELADLRKHGRPAAQGGGHQDRGRRR
ncbi:MAG: hypothetical protein R3C32_12055 [Chloroflexota bacterium]